MKLFETYERIWPEIRRKTITLILNTEIEPLSIRELNAV